MKKLVLLFIFVFSLTNINAQDSVSHWKNGGALGLNFTQVALSNWAGGGKSTIALTGLMNLFANFSDSNAVWDNSLDIGYGVTKLDKEDFRKSDDKIIFITKFGYRATSNLNYSALLDFRTQFNRGYNFDKLDPITNEYLLISDFMSPGYLNVSIGMSYKPVDYLQIMLSPISNRLIIVLNDSLSKKGSYGVAPGDKIKSELGSALNVIFKKEVFENVNVESRLNLFGAFEYMPSMVVNWNTTINMKINSFLSASLTLDAIYDEKIIMVRDDGSKGPATQFRNVLALGFSYKF